jgi:hypothetical protein
MILVLHEKLLILHKYNVIRVKVNSIRSTWVYLTETIFGLILLHFRLTRGYYIWSFSLRIQELTSIKSLNIFFSLLTVLSNVLLTWCAMWYLCFATLLLYWWVLILIETDYIKENMEEVATQAHHKIVQSFLLSRDQFLRFFIILWLC